MRLLIPELDMYLVDCLPGFSCRMCNRCCIRKLIPLYQSDIDRLKSYVNERFYEKTIGVERLATGAEYKMLMKKGKCIFLDKGLCRYYEQRPNTCRRHPFLVSEKHSLVSSTCPGVEWHSTLNDQQYRKLSQEISKSIDLFMEKAKKKIKTNPYSYFSKNRLEKSCNIKFSSK